MIGYNAGAAPYQLYHRLVSERHRGRVAHFASANDAIQQGVRELLMHTAGDRRRPAGQTRAAGLHQRAASRLRTRSLRILPTWSTWAATCGPRRTTSTISTTAKTINALIELYPELGLYCGLGGNLCAGEGPRAQPCQRQRFPRRAGGLSRFGQQGRARRGGGECHGQAQRQQRHCRRQGRQWRRGAGRALGVRRPGQPDQRRHRHHACSSPSTTASAAIDLWFGGDGGNNFTGTGGHDILVGGACVRRHLSGGDGFDFIDGGAGNDTLHGGDGSDILRGGTGHGRALRRRRATTPTSSTAATARTRSTTTTAPWSWTPPDQAALPVREAARPMKFRPTPARIRWCSGPASVSPTSRFQRRATT